MAGNEGWGEKALLKELLINCDERGTMSNCVGSLSRSHIKRARLL